MKDVNGETYMTEHIIPKDMCTKTKDYWVIHHKKNKAIKIGDQIKVVKRCTTKCQGDCIIAFDSHKILCASLYSNTLAIHTVKDIIIFEYPYDHFPICFDINTYAILKEEGTKEGDHLGLIPKEDQ